MHIVDSGVYIVFILILVNHQAFNFTPTKIDNNQLHLEIMLFIQNQCRSFMNNFD